MSLLKFIEILATLGGLFYVILLIKENIACWIFGICGSLLSIYLFLEAKLYSEALLYSYYVGMGCWGWIRWHNRENNNPVVRFSYLRHIQVILLSVLLGGILGYGFDSYTEAERPYIDALTTIFSFSATFMEVNKVLETWIYWIVINLVSIWLYQDRDLDIYAGLIGVYGVLSFWGFAQWSKAYQQQQKTAQALSV